MALTRVNVVILATAEEVGFEPTVALRPQRFSRPSDSSTLALLQVHSCNSTLFGTSSLPEFIQPAGATRSANGTGGTTCERLPAVEVIQRDAGHLFRP